MSSDEADKKETQKMAKVSREYVVKEVLLGMTIGFAQIPESVAFAFLANVSPPIALHAAWMIGLICSLFGGRPAMVNGATGAFAAIIGTFLPEPEIDGGNGKGIETLFPSVMLAGLLMLLVAALNLSRFIIMLPAPVMIGFCNGLAVVIGLAQLHPFQDSKTHEYKSGSELLWMLVIMFSAMLIMEFLPKIPLKLFKIIPSSLMGIIAAIAIEFAIVRPTGSRTAVVGDVSEFSLDTAFPVPFFINTDGQHYDMGSLGTKDLGTILTQGILLCTVGTIESLMTSEVVESFVNTPSNGDRTVLAMGVGNMLSGFMGGMGGNAMIGLSTINVLNGGTGRLAPTCTALLVMAAIMGGYPALNIIPVAALAGIMIVVVLHTFKWFSLKMILFSLPDCLPCKVRSKMSWWPEGEIPAPEAAVIVIVTLLSILMNIAYAVLAGTAVCGLIYSWNSAKELQVKVSYEGATKCYDVAAPMYFATVNKLVKILKVNEDPESVIVRYMYSPVNDYSVKAVFVKITNSYKALDKTITFSAVDKTKKKDDLVDCESSTRAAKALEEAIASANPSTEEPKSPKSMTLLNIATTADAGSQPDAKSEDVEKGAVSKGKELISV
jgi:SulP family sulfate permease